MSSSLPQTATNSQSLNGIITLTDGVITIEDGTITGLDEIDLTDLQVSGTATIENLVVNNQIDMTLGQIKNVSAPTDNGDATNKQYVDTNFLNKTNTTTQSVAGKLSLTNATTDIGNPIINLFNSVGGSDNGNFIRFQKGVAETSNTQIGGLSACDKNIGNTTIRVTDLIFSRGSNGEARMELKVIDGQRTPLTITDGVFTSKNNSHYFQKQDGTNLLHFTTSNDYWAMSKSLNMATNSITNVTDLSVNNQINLTKTTPTITNPMIKMQNSISSSNNGMFIEFYKNVSRTPSTQIGGLTFVDNKNQITTRAVQIIAAIANDGNPSLEFKFDSGNYAPLSIFQNHFIVRNDTISLQTENSTDLLKYISNKWTMYKELDMNTTNRIVGLSDPVSAQDGATKSYVDSHSNNENYLLRDGSLPMTGNLQMGSNNITIGTNKHLAFNSGDLTTTNGMLMNYDGGVGFLDMRGTEFRIRTAEAGVPNTIRFKVNDTNTTVRNNFFCDANCTFGNQDTDTATFNCKTTIHNILTFATGSRIDGARVQLIKSGNISYEMSDNNVENGVLCNNSSTISITMPAKSAYWNNRCYFVKVRTATVNLVQNTDTRIDDDESTLVMSSDFRGYLLQFDSDYENNGDIWRLCQI